MKKSFTVIMGIVLVLTIVLSGCSAKTAQQDAKQKDSGNAASATTGAKDAKKDAKPITLKMLHFVPYPKGVLQKFHEKYPNITVESEQADSANYNTLVRSRLVSKSEIDLVGLHTGGDEFGFAAKDNALLDITGAPYLGNFMKEAVDKGTYNGKVLGFTQGTYAIGVFYNKDLFAKLNLQVPKTWEEFLSVSEAIKKSETAPLVLSAKDSWTTLYYHMSQESQIEANNPGFFGKMKSGESKWTDPKLLDVYNKIGVLNKNGYFLKGSTGTSYDQAVAAFQKGQAAMWIMGNWALDKFPEDFKQFKVGAFAFPFNKSGEKLSAPIVSDGVLSGIAWTKHPEEVKKFLEFAALPEIAQIQSKEQKIFSTVKGGTAEFHPLAKEWLPLFDIGVSDSTTLYTKGVYNEIGNQIQKMLVEPSWSGDKVVDELQKTQEKDNASAK